MRLRKGHSAHRAKRALDILLSRATALRLLPIVPAIRLSAAAALILLVSSFVSMGDARAQDFVPGFEDMPLMFELDADEAPMVFDAPGGRIVEARASGHSSPTRVLAFYRETLPQLGWHATSPSTFVREGEQLRLNITEPKSGEVDVRFSLMPSARP
jgi:hypothetical protein